MEIPERTSAEALERYVGGNRLRVSRGKAWRDIKAWIIETHRDVESVLLPSVSEAFLAWTLSGEAEFEEREGNQPWLSNRIGKGSFFLTTGGAPYECRWKVLSPEPLISMAVFIALPLLQRAMEEVFGNQAENARLRDLSAFRDATLSSLMEELHAELMRKKASPLFVQGLGQAIAIHLARNYAVVDGGAAKNSALLPGFKLNQITTWMNEHAAEDFDLAAVAARAGISKFHFHRLFTRAIGVSPSQYHTNLRLDRAKKLLRETGKSIMDVALEVGYANPSHFSKLFRRENGLAPGEYRRQR